MTVTDSRFGSWCLLPYQSVRSTMIAFCTSQSICQGPFIFPRSQLYQCVSSETDDVMVHGMQNISHVTLTLVHSRAAKGQKERSCSVTVLLDCSICLLLHLLIVAYRFLGKIGNLLSMRSSRPALILPLLLGITSVMFGVLAICGCGQAGFSASTTSQRHFLRANWKVA